MLAPQHPHTRRLQLRGHQLARPNPARVRMPQRWGAGWQARLGDLGGAGQNTGIGWLLTLGQPAFAPHVVFQNARQAPIGPTVQQGLGALQRGLDTRAGDA